MATDKPGSGWLAFSGIMLILAGMRDIVDGAWALDHDGQPVDTILFDENLANWGWFYLIVGVVLVAAGVAVFNRAQWARWVGIVAASASIIINSFWIFEFPIAAFSTILLAVLVIYGLSVYGEGEGVVPEG